MLPVLRYLLSALKGNTNDIKTGQDELAYDRAPLKAVASVQDGWRDVVPRLPEVTQPLIVSTPQETTRSAAAPGKCCSAT